jgi:NAD(P)H-flavin reductase
MGEATVTQKTKLTPDIYQYVLELEDESFEGEAGQHLVLYDDEENGKPYSAVGVDDQRVVLMIRSYPNDTVSKWIGEQSVGDTVKVTTELTGNLTLQTDSDNPVFFVATGTGITPLIGMLNKYVISGGRDATFVLGEKTEEHTMYKALLEQYSVLYDVDVHFVHSRENYNGYVQEYIDEQMVIDSNLDYYTCGVPDAVVAVVDLLQNNGVPEERIHTEGWEL